MRIATVRRLKCSVFNKNYKAGKTQNKKKVWLTHREKKQPIEAVPEETQTLDLLDKDLK